MKSTRIALLLSMTLIAGMPAAQEKTAPAAPMSDQERIDSLIKQNQLLLAENARLTSLADRPKTLEETFAVCMQSAKGQTSAMAAESIGSHCDRILKQRPATTK